MNPPLARMRQLEVVALVAAPIAGPGFELGWCEEAHAFTVTATQPGETYLSLVQARAVADAIHERLIACNEAIGAWTPEPNDDPDA